jgi:carboxyl-terminal processing protease
VRRRTVAIAALTVVLGVGAFVMLRPPRSKGSPSTAPKDETAALDESEDERGITFKMPSGKPASLSCASAQTIIKQVRSSLAYTPPAVDAAELAKGTSEWLDPHGMWSAAEGAPIEAILSANAKDIIAELESAKPCRASAEVGRAMAPWVRSLRDAFEATRVKPAAGPLDAIRASQDTTPLPAKTFAEKLGDATGAAATVEGVRRFADAARERWLPSLSDEAWTEMVLAAAVRAYVPLVDPHGAWAPADEESTVYEVDLDARPAPRLWDRAERTAVGVRIEAGAVPPLAAGDVLLEISGLALGGLSPEQVDQVSFAAADGSSSATILRANAKAIETIELGMKAAPGGGDAPAHDLPEQRIAFGKGEVLVVAPHDIEDDLGSLLGHAIERDRKAVSGVILDLRGNGGGSTDGAIDALALFLPKATLFPMKRRDGTIETDRAPEATESERWSGPVATLVDGSTASAAEMIAGALAAYRRGPTVGVRTYGKGCAQEYVDDDASIGLLRMTTLLYALPDGSPVQTVGLTPSIELFPSKPSKDDEREATLPHAPPAWHGPDVRDRNWDRWETAWPSHDDRVGPCTDADVCRALKALGGWSPRKLVGRRR